MGAALPNLSDAIAIADVGGVRALLIEAARAREAVSYAGLLGRLGVRFTRPRMRALCRTLDRIDVDGVAAGEPALAVLVVRESDRLPGQGWWVARTAAGHAGAWTGAAARDEVARLQRLAFDHWDDQVAAWHGDHRSTASVRHSRASVPARGEGELHDRTPRTGPARLSVARLRSMLGGWEALA